MTKPVTIVAIMMLMEEGELLITDPVSKYIPAFKKTTVAVRPEGAPSSAPHTIVPAKREITIRDLLTHTAGIGYRQGVVDWYKAANALGYYHADKKETIGQVVERIATLAFEAQPGERWIKGFSTDILGHVVERISGTPLDEFFPFAVLAHAGGLGASSRPGCSGEQTPNVLTMSRRRPSQLRAAETGPTRGGRVSGHYALHPIYGIAGS
jgi:CubicO group peptidase (beta-lactamase class C family)